MFKKLLLLVGTLAFLLWSLAAVENTPKRKLVTLQLSDYPSQMKIIRSFNVDVAGVNLRQNKIDVVVSQAELDFLQEQIPQAKILATQVADVSEVSPQYKTPAEVDAELHQYARNYPELTELVEAGKSLEGRIIWAIKITSKTAAQGVKPALLINGMHHAREVMSVEVPLDAIDYLLKNYQSDPHVKHWVDNNEIWILPMLNVDGNNYMWTKDNMWRKNVRNRHGVDINRNYPYAWNSCDGSSGYSFAQDYRGPSAGSEPETQTLMNLVKKSRPVFNISFHSYSELVLYPYGCEGQRTPTDHVVERIGKEMAALLPSDDDPDQTYTPGTSWELLYSVDGGDVDWMYHEMGVVPYVIEVNAQAQGFQPDYDRWRDRTVLKIRKAWMMLLDKLDQSSVRGQILSQDGKIIENARAVISLAGNQQHVQKVNAAGYYHMVLGPGNYTIKLEADGYKSQAVQVEIKDTRLVADATLTADAENAATVNNP